jgi:hypothetical protein
MDWSLVFATRKGSGHARHVPRIWLIIGAAAAALLAEPVVALMGDGSMHYAMTALWSAANSNIPVTIVVASNAEYGLRALRINHRTATRWWRCAAPEAGMFGGNIPLWR